MSEADTSWPSLPTETEIYILPNGEIVVADLPVEIAVSLAALTNLYTATFEIESAIEATESTDPSHVTD